MPGRHGIAGNDDITIGVEHQCRAGDPAATARPGRHPPTFSAIGAQFDGHVVRIAIGEISCYRVNRAVTIDRHCIHDIVAVRHTVNCASPLLATIARIVFGNQSTCTSGYHGTVGRECNGISAKRVRCLPNQSAIGCRIFHERITRDDDIAGRQVEHKGKWLHRNAGAAGKRLAPELLSGRAVFDRHVTVKRAVVGFAQDNRVSCCIGRDGNGCVDVRAATIGSR